MAQILKLRRSAVSGQQPTNAQILLGELAINTTDGKIFFAKSGSLGESIEEVIVTNSTNTGSINIIGDISGSNGQFTSGVTSTFLDLNPLIDSASPAYKDGRLFYNSEEGALTFYNNESEISLQIGQEFYLRGYNDSGDLITNGTPVFISGSQGDNPYIWPAISENYTGHTDSNHIIGVATHNIEDKSVGYITEQGRVRDIDTSAFNAGDILYVQTGSAGILTNDEPQFPNEIIQVGYVVRSHPSSGIIFVKPREPIHFHDISGLSGTTAETGDIWVYQSNGAWTNTKNLNGSYTVTGDLSVNGNTTISGTSKIYFQNGVNQLILEPESVTSINTITIPDATGTILLDSDIGVNVQAYASDLQNLVDNYTIQPSLFFANNNFTLGGTGNINIGNGIGNLTFDGPIINNLGILIFNSYGSGNRTGTPTYYLAVDSSGNVIEETLPITVNIGTDNQIPFVNAEGTDFEYSTSLTFDGSNFRVLNNFVVTFNGETMYFDLGNSNSTGEIGAKVFFADDVGSLPVMSFVSEFDDGSSLTVRPLFAWYNGSTKVGQISAAGDWNFQGNNLNNIGQLNVDNLRLSGSTFSSTNIDGDIFITPNGSGEVTVNGNLRVTGDGTFSGNVSIANSTPVFTFTTPDNDNINATSELGKISWSVDDDSSGRVRQEGAYIKYKGTDAWSASTSPAKISFGILNDAGTFTDDVFIIDNDNKATFSGEVETDFGTLGRIRLRNIDASSIGSGTTNTTNIQLVGGDDTTGQDAGISFRNEQSNNDWLIFNDISAGDDLVIATDDGRAGDVLTLDGTTGAATFSGNIITSGQVQIDYDATGLYGGIRLAGDQTSDIQAISMNSASSVRYWMWMTGDGGTSATHNGHLNFSFGSNYNSNAPVLSIDSSSNVNLSTNLAIGYGNTFTIPSFPLQVTTSSGSQVITYFNSDNITGAIVDINNSTATGNSYIRFRNQNSTKGTIGYDVGADTVSLSYAADLSNPDIVINSSGDVSIPNGDLTVTGNILPGTDSTHDLGSTSSRFNNVYVDDIIYTSGDSNGVGLIVGDDGNGQVALSINDGYGNAQITFNHTDGVPDRTGNAFRITTNVDSTTSPYYQFQMAANQTADVATSLTTQLGIFQNDVRIAQRISDLDTPTTSYIEFPANNQWKVVTASTDALTIDSSQNVSIPNGTLTISKELSAEGSGITLNTSESVSTVGVIFDNSTITRRSYCQVRAGDGGTGDHVGLILMQSMDGDFNYLWFDNNNILRTSTTLANVGTTTGTVIGTQTSDQRLKSNLRKNPHGLQSLLQLETYQYEKFGQTEIGFMAQQAKEILKGTSAVYDTKEKMSPNAEDSEPTKLAMDYSQVIPILVEAIKELKLEIEELKK